jgi:hypothetical protein
MIDCQRPTIKYDDFLKNKGVRGITLDNDEFIIFTAKTIEKYEPISQKCLIK